MVKNKSLILLLVTAVLLLCSNNALAFSETCDKSNLSILVDLTEERLYLIDIKENKIINTYPVASGKESTPSPIGTWKIVRLAKWDGGFGSRWVGLNVPWGKYGIHGTNKPGSIGSEASHGCIRMLNRDVEDLYEYLQYGAAVVIYGGPYGPFEKGLKTKIPGDRGSAIFEVQRRMKHKGYYPGYLDGVYGENMKKFVLKFRYDNKLENTHDINKELYKKLGIELID